jgi:hypothetical protein
MESTRDSFIPSTIKMWNILNNTIRNVDTLSEFTSELKKIDETKKIMPFLNIIYMVPLNKYIKGM